MPAELTEVRFKEKGEDKKKSKRKRKRKRPNGKRRQLLRGAEGLIIIPGSGREKEIDKLGSLRALRDVICFVRRGTWAVPERTAYRAWILVTCPVLWPVPKSFAGHQPPLRGAFLEP